jgi:hypothetical protein
MAAQRYPQVWSPDGRWYASFYTKEAADRWVAEKNKTEPGWVVNFKRPEKVN